MNDIIKSIEEIVTQSERFKSSFFWNPPKNAWARRKYEEYNSRKKIDWEEGGDLYTAEFVVGCSCKNIYAAGRYTKNGKKTTLTAVKNSLNRLKKGGN